jgi:glycosyltransferase involved in cell wall biosynthesis
VWRLRPETRFIIAGRQPTPEVVALACDRVEIRANVPVIADVLHSADVAVFPDEYGLGIRNSVTEALAAGLPVVASPAAARGQQPHELLSVQPRLEDQIADTLRILAAAMSSPRPAMLAAGTPSWSTVAEEYLVQLRAAHSHHGSLEATAPGEYPRPVRTTSSDSTTMEVTAIDALGGAQ